MLESPQSGPTVRTGTERQDAPFSALDLPGFFDDDTDDLGDEEAAPRKRPWWRRGRWIAVIAVVLIALLIATPVAIARMRTPRVTYSTAAVRSGNLITTVSATGPLQSGLYDVNFSGSGIIAEIDVAIGQHVKAGQVLAKLDPTSLQDAVNAAQTALNNAYTNYNNAVATTNAQLNAAYQQEQNTINNTCKGNSSCISSAEAQYASTQAQTNAQLSQASQQIGTAQTNLTTAQHNLGNATLTAPHDGIVGAINGKVGGTPGAGGSSSGASGASGSSSSGGSGAFIEIVDLTSLQVTADVNEADISKVAVGQSVTFTVSAYGTQRFTGTVSAISPLGQTTSNVVTYPVTVNVDNSSLNGATLLPQMTANASIVTAQRTGVLLVPAAAITFARSELTSGAVTRTQVVSALRQALQMRAAAESSDASAAQDNLSASFVLERANNKWVVKPVVLGLTNGTFYEVVAGLSSGETIVTGQSGATTSGSSSPLTIPGGRGGFGGGNGGFGGGRGGSGGGNGAGGLVPALDPVA